MLTEKDQGKVVMTTSVLVTKTKARIEDGNQALKQLLYYSGGRNVHHICNRN